MKKILIFTGLVDVGKNLVGTAIIYNQIARLLQNQGFLVTLIVPHKVENKIPGINYHLYEQQKNKILIQKNEIIIFGAYPPIEPLLESYKNKKIVITYLWSIAPLGSLEFKDFARRKKQKFLQEYITLSYNLSLLVADKIFCRNEKIKDLIIGSLISLGRINLDNYQQEKNFQQLIEVAPFGLDHQQKPLHKKNIYRGVIESIKKNDWLLLWNGGIWNWHDPLTLIKAMDLVNRKNKKIKLIIQGFKHPDPSQPLSEKGKLAIKLAEEKKLINQNIFFIDKWFPFEKRGNYLSEVDAGIIVSPEIPEANYFIKTRFYDYLWAELPVIATSSEAFAPEIKKYSLGLVAKSHHPPTLAQAILSLAKQKKEYQKIKRAIRKFKKNFAWSKTLAPLANFCQEPKRVYDYQNQWRKKNIKFTKNLLVEYQKIL